MVRGLPRWLGRMLQGVRAGEKKCVFHDPALASTPVGIRLSSPEFADGGAIPVLYTDDGRKLSPPLSWSGLPAGTRAVLLIVEDGDSPTPLPFLHLVACIASGEEGALAAGGLNRGASATGKGTAPTLGRNGMFGRGWTPPDPPPGHGPHRYLFQAYALGDGAASMLPIATRSQAVEALRRSALAKGSLTGVYGR